MKFHFGQKMGNHFLPLNSNHLIPERGTEKKAQVSKSHSRSNFDVRLRGRKYPPGHFRADLYD